MFYRVLNTPLYSPYSYFLQSFSLRDNSLCSVVCHFSFCEKSEGIPLFFIDSNISEKMQMLFMRDKNVLIELYTRHMSSNMAPSETNFSKYT